MGIASDGLGAQAGAVMVITALVAYLFFLFPAVRINKK
jgi:hypothetical protein